MNRSRTAILRIVSIYFVFGLSWVSATNFAIDRLIVDRELRKEVALLKAGLFLVVTSILLFQLIRRYTAEIEAALQSSAESDSRLLRYTESAPVAVIVANRDGTIAEANPAAAELLGQDRSRIAGLSVVDLAPAEDRETVVHDFSRVFDLGHLAGQYRLVTSSGRVLWVSVHAERLSERKAAVFILDNTDQRQAEQSLRRYAHRLIEVKEDLRKKLAADLHDDIGRDLTALGMNLALIRKSLPDESRVLMGERLDETSRLLGQIHRAVRSMLAELRPPVLDERGLREALSCYVEDFTQRTGMPVALHAELDFPRLDGRREMALFRVLQEALNNVWKHAGETAATVTLGHFGTAARMCIADDGDGFDPQRSRTPEFGSGLGLTIMRERMEAVGGYLHLTTAPGVGTTVVAEIDLKED